MPLQCAFAPAMPLQAPLTRSAAPAMGLESELGATGPLLPYWDPLGLVRLALLIASASVCVSSFIPLFHAPDVSPPAGFFFYSQGQKASPEKFARWRAVEIKHGRIAMLASTGYIAQECFRWPGYLSPSAGVKFSEIPNGIAGLKAVPPAGLFQIFLGIALMEIVTWRYYEGPWPGTVPSGKAPGDVAGDLWVRYADPDVKKTKLNIELNNGRAAMLGVTGMLMHDHITGSWIPPGFDSF